jgi:hypothetical protein
MFQPTLKDIEMANYIDYYMQKKMEADSSLALSLDKSTSTLGEALEDTLNSAQMGAKRLLWRTSYFFDGYQDVNQQINREDYRMGIAIKNVIEKRDIIILMLNIYVENLLKNMDEKKRESIFYKLGTISSHFVTTRTAKQSISFSIVASIHACIHLNVEVRKNIRTISNVSLVAFQIYGCIEKSAIAANKLKRLNPSYYWALYKAGIEMLYFILDPVLSKTFYDIRNNNTVDDIVSILQKIIEP